MKIAIDQSFEGIGSFYREGIFVYNGFLVDALLTNNKNLEIDIWCIKENMEEFKRVYAESIKKYPDRINFITQVLVNPKWYQRNFFKYVWYAIIQNFYELLFKVTRKRKSLCLLTKYKDKKHALSAPIIRPLSKMVSKSDADVSFIDVVILQGAHLFKGPKVFMLHDLFTIPLVDLFRDLIPDIDELNRKAIDNLKRYADEGAYFVTSSTYIRDEQLLKYVSNLSYDKTSVISFPPMIKKFNTDEVLTEKKFRKKFNIDCAYIPYASQNRPNKNVILLLKALKRLKANGVKISVVTTGNFRGLKRCASYIKKNKLENMIIEIGSVSENDLYALYKYASLAVIPTIIEGLGMSGQCLEALSFGTIPVIHAKSLGIKESLELVGLSMESADLNWVDLNDDKGLAEKIEEVLKNPNSHIEKQKHIIDAYTKRTWDDVAHDYMDLFEKIINKEHKK